MSFWNRDWEDFEYFEHLFFDRHCFDELLVLVNDHITKQITNMRDASTPKLNLDTKIFHADLFVVLFSSFFLLRGALKFDIFHLTNLMN